MRNREVTTEERVRNLRSHSSPRRIRFNARTLSGSFVIPWLDADTAFPPLDAALRRRTGVAFLPYFPLASGLLTGKYRKGAAPPAGARLSVGGAHFEGQLNEAALSTVEDLVTFAAARHHTILELAFSWLLSHAPVASVIAGATKPAQIQANAQAASWEFNASDLEELEAVLGRNTR